MFRQVNGLAGDLRCYGKSCIQEPVSALSNHSEREQGSSIRPCRSNHETSKRVIADTPTWSAWSIHSRQLVFNRESWLSHHNHTWVSKTAVTVKTPKPSQERYPANRPWSLFFRQCQHEEYAGQVATQHHPLLKNCFQLFVGRKFRKFFYLSGMVCFKNKSFCIHSWFSVFSDLPVRANWSFSVFAQHK